MYLQKLYDEFVLCWIKCNQIRDTLKEDYLNGKEKELDILCNRFLNEFLPLSCEEMKMFYNYLYSQEMFLSDKRDNLIDNGKKLSCEDTYRLFIYHRTINYVKSTIAQKEKEKNLVKLIKQL